MVDWNMANTDASLWVKNHKYDLTYADIDITREQEKKLKQAIINFIESGMTISQLEKELVPPFREERARTIAVTEVTRAYSEGNEAAWRESGSVEGKEWLTSVDERVCPICGPLHGQIVPLNSDFSGPGGSFHNPPAHPRCRCDTAPVVILEGAELGALVYDPETGEFVRRDTLENSLAEAGQLLVDKQSLPSRPWWKFWQ